MDVIRIELKSNLCAGSGYSYAGIVDSDVCYDKVGLPYIPARRIKGVLKDAALILKDSDLITDEDINELFGVIGDDQTKGLSFRDAYIHNYKRIYRDLRNAESEKNTFSAQRVLEQFTTVVAQTKINEKGVAEDNSLRYTRVVNQYNPFNDENLVFEAIVDGLSNDSKEKLSNICKALRHMGLNRNRGFGNVAVSLVQQDEKETIESSYELELDDEKNYVLEYTLRNEQPLQLSSENDSKTMPFIKGQMIQGALAGAYLKSGKPDERFEELFVTGDVIFSNLYPTSKDGDKEYTPIPLFIGKYKKKAENGNAEYTTRIGINEDSNKGFPKPMRDQLGCLIQTEQGMTCYKYEPELEVIYHNRRKGEGVERLLYMSEVLSKGQYYKGTISGKGNQLKEVINLLLSNPIKLGKSKTAQYGTCSIIQKPTIKEDKKVFLKKSEQLIVVLKSDSVFSDDNGYITDVEEVSELLKDRVNQLVGKNVIKPSMNELGSNVFAIGKKQSGYYGVWNMRKITKPAISAGSTFCFECLDDFEINAESLWVGANNSEGYGECYLINASDYKKFNTDVKDTKSSGSEQGKSNENCFEAAAIIKNIELKILEEKLQLNAIETAKALKEDSSTNAFIGRLKLMLLESEFNNDSDEERELDFKNRITTIKNEKKVKIANKWIEKIDNILKETEYDDYESEKHRIKYDYLMKLFETFKYISFKEEENK